MTMTQLQTDFSYCEEIIKQHSSSFYYAFSHLPQPKANAVYAIYAFCRTADDITDSGESPVVKRKQLNDLKTQLDMLAQGKAVQHPMWRALAHVCAEYELDLKPFYDQLTGQFMDLCFASPATLAQLEHYSYHVAGSVGVMLLPVIASCASVDLRAAAVALGTAMQLTNILRDIGEDYKMNQRVYLPTELMNRYAYTQTDLQHDVINDNFVQLWETIAGRAEQLYGSFYESLPLFDADSRAPLYLSARVYSSILDAVRSSGYDCFSKRNYVSRDQVNQIHAAVSQYS